MEKKIKISELPEFDVTRYLDSEQAIAEYLTVVMEDNDPAFLAAALGDIAKARGMTEVAKKAGITDFWNALQCRATSGGVELYNGPFAAMRTTPLRIAPGGSAVITYAITLPADADNALQGDYMKASVYIDAEQTH